MSTVLIVAVIVVFVAVVAAFLHFGPGRGTGRGSLRRRFGPEYDRVLARHDGDTKATEAELGARVERHGSLTVSRLTPETRERYVARWTGLQEQFVDAPQQAAYEAERLVGALAHERGFPAADDQENHLDALSVHHPHHVNGYRTLHSSVRDGGGTEELRAAFLEARGLFGELVSTRDHDPDRGPGRAPGRQKVLPVRHHAKGEGA
ncbi:hypothetical protein [Streptomyces sp. NBC_00859]|uniref:hypothetical protein n=1 Tax=Streptomyces sp. NBC_00859 TaxID=2903682 RepID=UPI00386E16F9|nr:hypothetical protein OG584_25290 [Streptomyces sp. NBC_00859]